MIEANPPINQLQGSKIDGGGRSGGVPEVNHTWGRKYSLRGEEETLEPQPIFLAQRHAAVAI